MSLLTKDNVIEAQPSELELFQLPPYQTAVTGVYWEDCRPISQVTAYNPIEFNLSTSGNCDYLDLKRSRLYVKLKVKNANGENLKNDDTVGPVNFFLHSLWSQVDVYLQGQQISSSNTHYAYKTAMKMLLEYGQDAKSTHLTSCLYYRDRAGHMDSTTTNTGLYERRKFISNSKSIDMEGRLFHDLFDMDHYLLNMVESICPARSL